MSYRRKRFRRYKYSLTIFSLHVVKLQIFTSHGVFLIPFRILYAAALTSSKPTKMGSSDSPVTGFRSANLFTKPEPTRTKFEGDEGFFCSLSAMAAIFLPKQDCENILSNTYLIKSHIICIKFLCIT